VPPHRAAVGGPALLRRRRRTGLRLRRPADGFFWLCGQGGYGIMMSSSLGRTAASLITRGELPEDIAAAGVATADIGPERTRRA
jgi:glycine/D-amino acid oxidase-like deaminating enzyme